MPQPTTITTQNVEIKPKPQKVGSDELSDKIYYNCAFCTKTVLLYPMTRRICERMSGGDRFYCGFCLRHGFNNKTNKHILPLSFRSIIAYYYWDRYMGTRRELWFEEIKDYIRKHAEAGLTNPAFFYDPETFMWFVDFSRVGRGRRKIKLSDVQKTILNILFCFNLPEHIPNVKQAKLFGKYNEALKVFYEKRYRPESKPLLIPTLAGCGPIDTKKLPLDSTRNFVANDFVQVHEVVRPVVEGTLP